MIFSRDAGLEGLPTLYLMALHLCIYGQRCVCSAVIKRQYVKFRGKSGSGIWDKMRMDLINMTVGLENARNSMLFVDLICDHTADGW